MPLHDWSELSGWEGVHDIWIVELLRWIKPRLPPDYRAYVGSCPALAIGTAAERPDVAVKAVAARACSGEPSSGFSGRQRKSAG